MSDRGMPPEPPELVASPWRLRPGAPQSAGHKGAGATVEVGLGCAQRANHSNGKFASPDMGMWPANGPPDWLDMECLGFDGAMKGGGYV